MVSEDDLEEALPESALKIDGKLRSQQRDVAKFWKNCNIRIALYGFENQTSVDRKMPLRVIAYDGIAYKQQLVEEKDDEDNKKVKFYSPVVTLVLYFHTVRTSCHACAQAYAHNKGRQIVKKITH